MKPLLVGEANPYGTDPEFALYPLPENASGGRLARILGLSRGEYLRRFDRCNLCPSVWSAPTARAAAADICAGPYRVVIALGTKVARAFGYAYEPVTRPRPGLILLPHPSGLNRAWADPTLAPRVRALLAEFLEGPSCS